MSVEPLSSLAHLEILRDRAKQLQKLRSFFAEQGVLEVDCPCLTSGAALDAHIDLFATDTGEGSMRYLHSSPEFGMKRLLSQGLGDIYQLSHVFRFSELSKKHQPEFTMLEWYRVGVGFDAFINQTLEVIRLLLGALPKRAFTYKEAFLTYTGIDPFQTTAEELLAFLKARGVQSYSEGCLEDSNCRDDLLNQILGLYVEPYLGWLEDHSPCLTILSHYPASQAALAKTVIQESNHVAERFEVYSKGMELANGYHELTDAVQQERRFHETNQLRIALGKTPLPIDHYFLDALKAGMPECCGVAVGFDRLMMLRHDAHEIAHVIPFSWENS